ncbi:MAG: hypothetical protein M1816_002135 [Peltula sp. TS41687]|nr:MAG: hypothetical protein M1816_002135 [Peltula sp. TS41687]
MPRAEVGSTKYLNNKLKFKGLQRLRWYCQVCERQMRDENGFKCHTQSESHVRQMLLVGEDPRKHIQDFSNQFQRDFLMLLKTSHGEKKVHINHFYQEYISNKEHVHMNATRWPSLTEFAKHLGREGICRVEDTEKGLHISWIDNSPEALRRQDAIRKKERQDKGDEEREQRLIQEQVERARQQVEERPAAEEGEEASQVPLLLQREDGEKFTLSLSGKQKEVRESPDATTTEPATISTDAQASKPDSDQTKPTSPSPPSSEPKFGPAPVKISVVNKNKPKNVFAAAAKKSGAGNAVAREPPKRPMSEAERIMREELERKRGRESGGGRGTGANMIGVKRQRVQ